jgi:hypothetical protein
MLSLDDPRWSELKGGYKLPFDPRPLLRRLESEVDLEPVWSELWNELHHQGDVGEASYAAVPHIVRIYCQHGQLNRNAYGIVAIVELARTENANPEIPNWLKEDYFASIDALAKKGISELSKTQDPELCREMLGVIALSRGLRNHAEMLAKYSDEEMGQMDFAWKE